ncbi:MAG TPA: S41 family peptidase [Candidatus Nanopelagicales bacterium]|nr:S41 family peptidase [Candidatus Nanopelagicales bacterium]
MASTRPLFASRRLRGGACRSLLALALGIVAPAAGCVGPEERLDPIVDCSVEAQNSRLLETMRDVYFWYDQIPDLDPRAFESPVELMDAIRYRERDLWSRVSPQATVSTYYRAGQTLGMGLRWKLDEAGALWVTLVYPESGAGDAGMQRGDEVLSINGVSIATIDAEQRWGDITGEDAEGVPVRLEVRRAGMETQEIVVQKRVYTLLSVFEPKVLEVGGRKIGYLLVDRFISPSYEGIRKAFAALDEAGVDDLILDLRYNGGGLTEASRYLASLIGGKEIDGRAYSMNLFNARNRDRDDVARFSVLEHALDLPRVAVIATDSTASASEMLINGLDPWLKVGVIGDVTYGKPVGSISYDDCGSTVTPIMFKALNADGDGEWFDGLPVDCAAEDDLSAQLGDPAEASVAEAIHWLMSDVDGDDIHEESCSTPPEGEEPAQKLRRRSVRIEGLREEIGAF